MAEDGRSPTDNDVVAQLSDARRQSLIAAGKLVAHKSGSRIKAVAPTASQVFSRAGLVTARRGRIGVADADGLREIACECYEVVRAATAKSN
jgi:hypothetical protein